MFCRYSPKSSLSWYFRLLLMRWFLGLLQMLWLASLLILTLLENWNYNPPSPWMTQEWLDVFFKEVRRGSTSCGDEFSQTTYLQLDFYIKYKRHSRAIFHLLLGWVLPNNFVSHGVQSNSRPENAIKNKQEFRLFSTSGSAVQNGNVVSSSSPKHVSCSSCALLQRLSITNKLFWGKLQLYFWE